MSENKTVIILPNTGDTIKIAYRTQNTDYAYYNGDYTSSVVVTRGISSINQVIHLYFPKYKVSFGYHHPLADDIVTIISDIIPIKMTLTEKYTII